MIKVHVNQDPHMYLSLNLLILIPIAFKEVINHLQVNITARPSNVTEDINSYSEGTVLPWECRNERISDAEAEGQTLDCSEFTQVVPLSRLCFPWKHAYTHKPLPDTPSLTYTYTHLSLTPYLSLSHTHTPPRHPISHTHTPPWHSVWHKHSILYQQWITNVSFETHTVGCLLPRLTSTTVLIWGW